MSTDLVTSGGGRKVINRRNGVEGMLGCELCLHEVFRSQARREPTRQAIALEDRSVSYGEIDAMSDCVAAQLTKRGAEPEERIAIWATRSVETVVAVLGTLKAGACFVMLDDSVPTERRSRIIESTGIRTIVAPDGVPIPHMNITCMRLQHPTGVCEATSTTTVHPDSLACIFHTSGSTGTPKGVGLTHRGMVLATRAIIQVKGIDRDDRWLLYKPVTFDVWCMEFFTALLSGACLQVLPADRTAAGADLLRTVRDQGSTVLFVPPSILRVLPRERLPRVRTMLTGAEPVPAEVARHWARDRRMFNSYGLTECGLASTWHEIRQDEVEPVPIGRPLPGVTVQVVDDDLRPVPAGQRGELLIGGSLLARGYLGDPAATAERFVPDPAGVGSRACRSGDLAWQREDGALELVGRRDQQVKVSGVRIDPGEVEAAVRAHPGVDEAAVVAVRRGGETDLVAHVACRAGAAVAEADLREFLRRHLPAAMVPARIEFAEALPHTEHGKVDRRALTRMHASAEPPAEPSGSADPDGAMEAALAGVVASLLRRSHLGPDDNLFEHGVHSLLAARLVVVVKDLFGVDLDVASVLRAPTARELSALVRERRQAAPVGRQ